MRPAGRPASTGFSQRTNLPTAEQLVRRVVGALYWQLWRRAKYCPYEETENQPTFFGEAAAVERRRIVLRRMSQIYLSERGNRPGEVRGPDSGTEGAKAEAFPSSPHLSVSARPRFRRSVSSTLPQSADPTNPLRNWRWRRTRGLELSRQVIP